jgi:hypothetical protein
MVAARTSDVAVCLASATTLSTDISVHSTVSNLDIPRGLALFNQYGSNIRVIVGILNKPAQEARVDLIVPLLKASPRFATL